MFHKTLLPLANHNMYDRLALQSSRRGVPYSFQELLGGDTNLNDNTNRVEKGEMVELAAL